MAKKEDIQGFKTYLQGKGTDITKATSQDAMDYKASLNPAPTQANLEAKIKTGNFTSKEALDYNRMTGDKQGAREVALGSQDATTGLDSIKTTVTPDEIAYMKSQGNNKINKSNITLDTTGLTPQEVVSEKKQALETPVTPKPVETKIEKPTTTTDITYSEDKNAYSPDKVISKAEQFIGADGKTYQTVRNSDNTLTTIDVTTGQPVTSKYTDAERDSIKQGFLKSPEQVQADQQKQVMNDPNVIYEQLKTGAFISKEVQNIPEYKKAYQRKQNLDRFSGMSTTDLATSIESGAFLPGTQVYDDLKLQNPKLVADAEAQNSINSINKPKTDVVDIQTKITDYLTKLMSDDEKVSYKETLSGNKEIIELNKTLAESGNKLAEYKDQLEYLEEDIKKDLEGRSITKGYKNFIMGERNREISRLYNQELSNYNTIAGQIQTISEGIKYDMEEARKQEQDRMQNIQTAVGMYQTMTADQRALDLNQKKLEQEYAYTYGDINSANPTLQNIAIERAVADLYTKYPLPGMESQATKVAKVQNLMSQGMTGSQAIAQLENEIRNTERYKQYITPKTTDTKYGFQNVGGDLYRTDDKGNINLAIKGKENNKWTKLDDGMYQDGEGNIITAQEMKQQKLLSNNYLNADIGSNSGLECGGYAIRATGMTNVPGGNSLTDRKQAFNEGNPKIGGLVLFNKGYDKTYGHIAVITGINQDGTINIKESNLHGDKKITERYNIDPTTKSGIWGYYNNTPLAGGNGNESSGIVKTILGSGKFTKDQATAITNAIDNGEDPFTVVKQQAKQLLSGANQTKLESYENARDILNDLAKNLQSYYNAGGDTGILKGNLETLYNKFGEVNNPNLRDLATQIQGNLQVYRNAISGTAYSEQEGKDISSIFPGINKSKDLNKTILEGRQKLFDSTIDSMYENQIGKKAYQELKKKYYTTGGNQTKTTGTTQTNTETDLFDKYY